MAVTATPAGCPGPCAVLICCGPQLYRPRPRLGWLVPFLKQEGLRTGGTTVLNEYRELPFDHPIAIYLRGPCGRDRRVSRTMMDQLGLDPAHQWRFESVVWQPPGATAAVTLSAPPALKSDASNGVL